MISFSHYLGFIIGFFLQMKIVKIITFPHIQQSQEEVLVSDFEWV